MVLFMALGTIHTNLLTCDPVMKNKSGKIKKVEKELAEEKVRKAIGKHIKDMRQKLGHSARRVAEELSVSREAITQMENGRNNISAVFLWKLAILFNCDIQDFFPLIPDGYALTKVDLRKVAQEAEGADEWAEALFGKKK